MHLIKKILFVFCLLQAFPADLVAQGDTLSSSKMLVLMRHAKPDIKFIKPLKRKEAVHFFYSYDHADILPFDTINVLERLKVPDDALILCSEMKRSKQTSLFLFGNERDIHFDSTFNEFDRGILNIPFLTLSPQKWLFLSRAFWMMGVNYTNTESYKDASARARDCARRIEKYSCDSDYILLVGHGFMNFKIAKSLIESGWRIQSNNGRSYLGAIILIK